MPSYLYWPGTRTALFWSAAIVLLIALGAVVVLWLGIYNVAASKGHFAVTRSFLELGMRNSVQTHSAGVPAPPPLDDADRIKLGASAYQGGCALCHGAPGQPPSPIVQQMLPAPPELSGKLEHWSPEDLFWIIKHGLKYTAMPGWTSKHRDDEIWSVVAFLQKYRELEIPEYQRLAQGRAHELEVRPKLLVNLGAGTTAMAVCARCHGDETTAPESSLVPKLAGLPADYLERALHDYSSGSRPSGIMQPVASELTNEHMKKLAHYYAGQSQPSYAPRAASSPEQISRGQKIAVEGVADANIPACMTCHAGSGLPTYPILIGQYPRYIAQQLRLWQRGLRAATPEGKIMAPIAKRLNAQQIEDVAAYFGSLGTQTAASENRGADPQPQQ